MRVLCACLLLLLLTGCSLLSQQTQSDSRPHVTSGENVATNHQPTEENSDDEIDPASLPAGQWLQVRLNAEKRGTSETPTSYYIGQLQRTDDESITLTEVTRVYTAPLTATVWNDEPAPVTVRLDRIECLNPITAERAAQFKQPRERVGMDYYSAVAFDEGGQNVDPTSLPPGQWCEVRLHDKQRRFTKIHTTYIGQLQKADDDSIKLTEVTTWGYHSSTSPLRKLPSLEDIFTDGAAKPKHEPAPITVRRDRITRVTPITAERAAHLKEPLRPFGVDFDFEQGSFELGPPVTVNRWGREVVAEQKTH